MSKTVHIITSDSIVGYDGEVHRFPRPLVVTAIQKFGYDAIEMVYTELQECASKLGANAVISVNHNIWGEPHGDKYKIRAVGLPVYLDPPLAEPQEFLKVVGEEL